MAKLVRLTEVGIFTKNQKLSKEFYTRKLGLKVRSEMPEIQYVQLGTTKGGADAGLDIWQPVKQWGEPMYSAGLNSVGSVTGIGYSTGNLAKTVEDLSRKGVKIETEAEGFARFWDPDRNVSFLVEQERPKVRRSGVNKIEWMTVAVRNAAKTGEFYEKKLGLRAKTIRGGEGEGDFKIYRVSPDQTSIMPFTPAREMYDNPSDYEEDLAHIGEDTSMAWEVDDIYAYQKKLLAKGVKFAMKAEEQKDWGGIAAKIYDPDKNIYVLFQWA